MRARNRLGRVRGLPVRNREPFRIAAAGQAAYADSGNFSPNSRNRANDSQPLGTVLMAEDHACNRTTGATAISVMGGFPPATKAVRGPLCGNLAVCSEFVREHYAWLYGWLVRVVGQSSDAADLTQDAFAAFWESLRRETPAVGPRTWLFAIARNRWRKHCRARAGLNGRRRSLTTCRRR